MKRLWKRLAVVAAAVALVGLAAPVSFAKPSGNAPAKGNPKGNNGTVNVDGVAFDSINQQMNFQNAGPAAAQMQTMMNYLFGPNGPTSMIGQVGDKVLVANGLTDQTLASAIAFVNSFSASSDLLCNP